MHHSDRGSQYASHAFQDKLKEYGMACSMSRKGNCWDNAPTECWFNSFKNEWVHGIRYATHADMKATSFEYIEVFYNRKRQHSTLGSLNSEKECVPYTRHVACIIRLKTRKRSFSLVLGVSYMHFHQHRSFLFHQSILLNKVYYELHHISCIC